ncbi:MFS transporter [Sphingobium nicotianae]|uniref:MFS transporter n=1 Tax=Sphingobium nicotianae TaxID=2782607 RepID=A0A9X1DD33_9SPHN|nr:MFS transporter [Sphingobium nicotianae]MBT2187308.1 MFS transporter [Sphingobium nicotianae]
MTGAQPDSMPTSIPQSMDADTFVDGLALNRFHIIVIALCTLLTAIDGYELYVVGWVLPLLAKDFHVAPAAVTAAMIAQQTGMLIGAFLIPPFADRLGRPRVLLICYAGMMVAALGILTAHTLPVFAAWRFFAGLCGTAMIPILVTIASETAPKRLRGTMSAITVSGTMLGSLFGAIMQAVVLEPFGWRGAFWIAAALPAIMLPLVHFLLPESLRARAGRNPDDPAIQTLARAMQPRGAPPVTIVATPRPAQTGGATKALVAEILGPDMRVRTLLMWAITISSFVFITAGVWKTTIFKEVLGLSWQMVAAVNATETTAGVLGTLSIGFFIDRLGFKRVMVATFLTAALGCALIGVTAPGPLMFVALVMLGMCQHGGQAGVAALAAALYPSRYRATGVGWAYGAGRVASIFAPLFGAFVLSEGFGAAGIFAMLALPLASAGLFSLWLMSLNGAPRIQRAALAHG